MNNHFIKNRSMIERFLHNAQKKPARMIALSFFAVILVGSFLLSLPIATANGIAAGWTTALFTAVSATCVTGLVVADTALFWSLFGQIVILCLIQIGGLGLVTLTTFFFHAIEATDRYPDFSCSATILRQLYFCRSPGFD
jgi:trk system potassium uptake protein